MKMFVVTMSDNSQNISPRIIWITNVVTSPFYPNCIVIIILYEFLSYGQICEQASRVMVELRFHVHDDETP